MKVRDFLKDSIDMSKQEVNLIPYSKVILMIVSSILFCSLAFKAFEVIDYYHLSLLHCGG